MNIFKVILRIIFLLLMIPSGVFLFTTFIRAVIAVKQDNMIPERIVDFTFQALVMTFLVWGFRKAGKKNEANDETIY